MHTAGLLLYLAVSSLDPYEREIVIQQASELVPWCKAEVESQYVAQGITTYQWTASYHDRANILYVKGRLRVHDDYVEARCRIAKGERLMYMTVEIDDPAP